MKIRRVILGAERTPALMTLLACTLAVACGADDKSRRVLPAPDGGAEAATPIPDAAPPPIDGPGIRPVDARPPALDAGPPPKDASSDTSSPTPTDASIPVDASVPLTGSYVNPATGLDTNDGTTGTPFRTIRKAAQTVVAGQAIFLQAGVYDGTTQGAFGAIVPAGVRVVGPAGGVTLHGAASDNAFLFQGGGGVENVWFDGFAQGLNLSGTGAFDVKGVQFNAVGTALLAKGSLKVTVDAATSLPFVTNVPTSGAIALIDNTTDVTFTGGNVSNVSTTGGYLFLTRGSAKLTLDGMTFDTIARHVVVIYDNADAVLRNVSITGVTVPSSGIDNTVIAMGGQNTAQPLDPSLVLDSTSITNNQVSAIALSLYGNLPSKPVIQITNSHLDGNKGYGLVAQTPGTADPALLFSLDVTNTTVNGDTLGGLVSDIGTFSVTGGDVSGNGGDGIRLSGTTFANALKIRGGTTIGTNVGHGVSFAGTAASILDLGKLGDPGNVAFSSVAANQSAVNLVAPIQGFAIGDTWVPGVQGASAQGTFTGAVTLPAASAGTNATVAAGASLVVSQ